MSPSPTVGQLSRLPNIDWSVQIAFFSASPRRIDSSSSLILRRAFGRPKRPSSSSSSVSVVIPPDVPESQLFGAAACVCAFWFLGQFTFDASLNSTDVTVCAGRRRRRSLLSMHTSCNGTSH